MVNPDHTPLRNVRIDAETWEAAKAVAATRGETLSDVIRQALVRYVKRHADRPQTPDGNRRPGRPIKEQNE